MNCESPCVLLFNESFPNDWGASIDGQPLPHFKIDDYVDAYLIEKPGDWLVEILFEPQRWFEIAVVVSATTAAATALTMLVLQRRRKRHPARYSKSAVLWTH